MLKPEEEAQAIADVVRPCATDEQYTSLVDAITAALKAREAAEAKCEWTWNPHKRFWATGCGDTSNSLTVGPMSSVMTYCPFCGKEIQ